jgi:hypothetical protein
VEVATGCENTDDRPRGLLGADLIADLEILELGLQCFPDDHLVHRRPKHSAFDNFHLGAQGPHTLARASKGDSYFGIIFPAT